jgi:hypothetical protein
MGRMKELYMQLLEIYDGEIPEDITIEEAQKIIGIKTLNWEVYEEAERTRKHLESGEPDKRKTKKSNNL